MGTVPAVATSQATRKPTVTNPWLQGFAVAGLIGIGVVLLVLASIALFDTTAPGTSKVAKTSTTSVAAPPKELGGTTTTTVLSTEATTPGKSSVRSESVAAALFGLGSILVLTGIFFGRIQEVTLPGGGGVKLISPEVKEAVTEKVAEKVEQDPALTADPKTAIALYEATLNRLQSMGELALQESAYVTSPVVTRLGSPPSDDILDQVVDRAAESLH
jgi:hypothetical protein